MKVLLQKRRDDGFEKGLIALLEPEGHGLLRERLIDQQAQLTGPGFERDGPLVDQKQKADEQVLGMDFFGIAVFDADVPGYFVEMEALELVQEGGFS